MNSRVLKKSAIYLIGNFSSKILMAIIIPIYAFYIQSSDLGYCLLFGLGSDLEIHDRRKIRKG